MDESLQFRILGPLEAWRRGRPVDLGRPKQRAVLAALLINANRVVPLDRLVDMLWGEEPPARATGALQVYVSGLRRVLEPERELRSPPKVLLTRNPGYLLRVGEDQLDANRFELLAAKGQQLLEDSKPEEAKAALVAALALWRGAALADFAFEPFAQGEAARLEELRDAALEELCSANLRLGRHVALAAELETLVAERPLRERRWAQLMVALYRSERQSDALRAFTRAREILREELGIEPGPVLRRLQEDIFRQSPSLDWCPPEDLPRRAAPVVAEPGVRFDPQSPVVPGGLVGRDAEMRALKTALSGARAGRGGLVLVSGEPGIGKTRLVEELRGYASAGGVAVAWGRCHEGEGAPAFWPWVQVIRSLLGTTDEQTLRRALGPTAGEIAQIAPEVKEFISELDPPAALDAAAARFRLYEAVFDLLARIAATRPLVVLLEDLHWADLPSLRLAEMAAGRIQETGLLLVATYRDVDPLIGGPLAETLGTLALQPTLLRLPLEGLNADEVGLFMTLTVGSKPSPEVSAAVHARTDGNPFFVAELARLLASENALASDKPLGDQIPAGVRDVIRRRLARLPGGTNELLEVASVLGRDVDLRLVVAAMDSPEQDSTDLIDASVAVGILVEAPGAMGVYRFSHALVQETIYGQLGPARRARLHARAAKAVEQVYGLDDGHVAVLAHHLSLATPVLGPVPAYQQLLRAAEVAERRLAYEEAEEHLRRALEAVLTMAQGEKRSHRELAVQHRLAALLSVAQGCYTPEVARAWKRAEELAHELGAGPEALASTWGMARLTRNRGQYEASSELGNQLLEMARWSKSSEPAVAGHETLGLAAFYSGDPVLAAEHLGEALTLSDKVAFAATAITSVLHPAIGNRAYLACVQWILGGDECESDRLIAEAVTAADSSGGPLNRAISRLCAAKLAVLQGDAARAAMLSDEVLSVAETVPIGPLMPVALAFRSWAFAHEGDVDAADAGFGRSMLGLQRSGWRLGWTCYLFMRGDAHRVAGRFDQALVTVEQGLTSAETTGEHYFDAELLRLGGEVIARSCPECRGESQGWLRRAVATAEEQRAVAFARRAEASLARLS